jgi:hypothetical protein
MPLSIEMINKTPGTLNLGSKALREDQQRSTSKRRYSGPTLRVIGDR